MWSWKDVANLRIFKSMRMKPGAVVTLDNADHTTTDVNVQNIANLAPSARIVNTTATALAMTAVLHEGKTVKVSSTAPVAVTLPAATGGGNKFRVVVAVDATGTPHTIKTTGTGDVFAGVALVSNTAATGLVGFATTATSNTISLNGTTKSGLVGTVVELEDIADGTFAVRVTGPSSGTAASPFSNS